MASKPQTREEKLRTIRYMVKHWNEETLSDLGQHTGANLFQIGIYASTLRRKGVNLPRKSANNFYSEDLLVELKKMANENG